MRYLGLDIGGKRVGIALSDEEGRIAFPLSEVGTSECVRAVHQLSKEKEVSTVVVGESLALDGSKNPIMEVVEEIAEQLKESVAVVFHPEQFSTQQARRLGKGSDAEAATILLQSYLDMKRGQSD